MDCGTPGFPVHHQLPELAQTHVHWVSDAIQPSHPLFPSPPAFIFPSIRVFSNESALSILELQLHSPSSKDSGLMSFRINWFDLLAIQGRESTYIHTYIHTYMYMFIHEISFSLSDLLHSEWVSRFMYSTHLKPPSCPLNPEAKCLAAVFPWFWPSICFTLPQRRLCVRDHKLVSF